MPRAPSSSPAAPTKKENLAVLTISSKNYGAWALRGWLMAKMAQLPFREETISPDDPRMKAEILLLASSMQVPKLVHQGITVWDTMAIGEYLNDTFPKAGLLPAGTAAKAHCRAVCGEMHSGFASMRGALPMNIKAHCPGFKVWSRAQSDIDRIIEIWDDCLAQYGGPYLFGSKPTLADAMFAPVVTRFLTYDIALNAACATYCNTIMAMPAMQEWVAAARLEPEAIDELEAEF
ncbi:glutathione S-transferase [Lampropedia puyangensis]|uniref:Glutathione S-transferase n=1 Tax=Lampropedia puyangensis TaxID=1330072 RepID=A0A4S8EVY1_9BURK|nr:glutathione S-transferase [Lampropedia puyangensis]THT98696.1 glutathione S-transferase [Lampropedia puyangensis]